MKTELEIVKNQIDLQHKIQKAGFNIVTCGMCGDILLHEIKDEKIECLCGIEIDLNDCPDLWFTGVEIKSEFKD
jgi:hypothetical protein